MKKKEEKKLLQIKDSPFINLSIYDFEGEIDEVCQKIQEIKNQIKTRIELYEKEGRKITPFEAYKKISIKISRGFEDTYLELVCEREETDEELEKRIQTKKCRKESAAKSAKKRKEEQEKKRKRTFCSLKKEIWRIK